MRLERHHKHNLQLLPRIYQHIASKYAVISDKEKGRGTKDEHKVQLVLKMWQPCAMEKDSNINAIDYLSSVISGPVNLVFSNYNPFLLLS